ncbi:hypothetical protein JSMCR1_p382 (plasmid) [Escherichia coli]|nr:hypothetical protein JSMCR1_p382 [Escherichia coli]
MTSLISTLTVRLSVMPAHRVGFFSACRKRITEKMEAGKKEC